MRLLPPSLTLWSPGRSKVPKVGCRSAEAYGTASGLCTGLYRDLRVLQMITAYTYSGLSEPAQRECGTWQGMGHLVTAHLDHPLT